jgi:hypothetical protein
MSCVRGLRSPHGRKGCKPGSCTGIRVARLRDITADLQGRLDLINRLRRDEDERHSEALEALNRQLRNEKERHQDAVEAIERDREMVAGVLDLESQFLSESRVKDLQRELVRAGETADALANEKDAAVEGPVSILRRRRGT